MQVTCAPTSASSRPQTAAAEPPPVCITTSRWHSAYPTAAHERHAKEVGLPANKVEAIIGGMPVAFDDEREQIVYEMAMVLSQGRWVPRGLHDRAVKALGHVGVTDVITLMR